MKKKTKIILTLVLSLIAIICIAYIIYYFTRQKDNGRIYEQVQNQVKVEQSKEPEKREKPEEPDIPKEQNPIDFNQLQEMNPDIYAWISIPNTNINYPIAQSATDNAYYLDNTIDGQAGLPGSIYTENYNQKDFSDFNTVIYGHDMLDGSMFQNLHNYKDLTFFQEHLGVIIYTPEKKLTYEIYSAVTYDDRHIIQSFDFTQESQRQAYLDSLQSVRDLGSNFNDNVSVDVNSHIITMSTCIGNQPNNRFLVGAVLVDEYEYEE